MSMDGETPDEGTEESATVDETATPAETTDTPAEADTPKPEGETPAEGKSEEKPAEPAAAKPVDIPEDILKAAATKFANRTMAAARRAETSAKALTGENAKLKETVGQYEARVAVWRTNPAQVVRDLGFDSIKKFVDAVIETGGAPKPPTLEERLAKFEKEKEDDKRARQQAEETARVAAEVEGSQAKVFTAVDKLTDRYDFATTEVGHDLLWEAIEEYYKENGECPDDAVFALADGVEKHLAAKMSNVKRFRQDPGAKTGQTAAKQAGSAARGSGKTLAGNSTSGAPGKREYSLDPDERRRQVNEDMKADGLI